MTAGLRITVLLAMALGAWPVAAEVLSGTVLEDHTGDPLGSVSLRLTQPGNRMDIAALETDANGRFHAEGIPAGEYTVAISKPNYAPATLHLTLDSATKPLLVRLARYGVIAGRVTDAEGNTPQRTLVYAVTRGPGGTLEIYGRQTPLEESGAFRVFNLPPGEYALAAQQFADASASGDTPRPASGFKLRFYPDNQAPRWFLIEGGEEYTQINFNVAAERLFRVSGLVRPAGRSYLVSLTSVDRPEFSLDRQRAYDESDAGGAVFEFGEIPAGSYYLFAVEASPFESEGDRLLVRSRVDVLDRDVEGLALTAGPGLTASFILDEDSAVASCPPTATLTLTPLGDRSGNWSLSRTVAVSSAEPAVLTGLAPGPYLTALSGLGDDCFGASEQIEIDGARDEPVPLKVTAAASLEGRLIAGESSPTDYFVLLSASEAPGTVPPVLAATPDSDASFSFAGLRPGRYEIAVVPATVGSHVSWANVPRMMELDLPGGAVTEIDLPIPNLDGVR